MEDGSREDRNFVIDIAFRPIIESSRDWSVLNEELGGGDNDVRCMRDRVRRADSSGG